MGKRIVKEGAPLTETGQAIQIGKPIMDRAERERSDATLVTYFLPPEELKAYNNKHGWPTRPLHNRPGTGIPRNKPKGGKGA